MYPQSFYNFFKSGSRINYNKKKAISIGNARHRKPKFNKNIMDERNCKNFGGTSWLQC
jgi:hypothetical protein